VTLTVDSVRARYESGGEIVRGVSIEVRPGEIVCLLGPNGAGKSSVLRAIAGMMKIVEGSIRLGDIDLTNRRSEDIARSGVGFVMQGRCAIPFMTVHENLRMGGYTIYDRARLKTSLERTYDNYPVLAELRNRLAGELSGGQQQLVEIARALVPEPDLLLVDEPSLGLAPKMADDVMELLANLAAEGRAVLMVEQNVKKGLSVAHRGYVLANGVVVLAESSAKLLRSDDLGQLFLGAFQTPSQRETEARQ
jgi:branched-chain amino acid transport system ATP-binding protein